MENGAATEESTLMKTSKGQISQIHDHNSTSEPTLKRIEDICPYKMFMNVKEALFRVAHNGNDPNTHQLINGFKSMV
jgi:hypothetical protein